MALGSNRPLIYDRRKWSVTINYIKVVLFFLFLRLTGLITPLGFVLVYTVGGFLFSVLICFEPYLHQFPTKLTRELYERRPGFGFSGKYIFTTTLKQYRLNEKHHVLFYWIPYNELYVQCFKWGWLRRKVLNATYQSKIWSILVVFVGLRYYECHTTNESLDTLKLQGSSSDLLSALIWEFEGSGMKAHKDLIELSTDLALKYYQPETN